MAGEVSHATENTRSRQAMVDQPLRLDRTSAVSIARGGADNADMDILHKSTTAFHVDSGVVR